MKVSGGFPHLKPHLKTQCALSTLGVIFLIYLPNYLITEKSHLRLCAARAQASRAPLPMPSMAHSSLPQGTQSATPCHPCSHPPPFLFVDRRWLVLGSSRATSPTRALLSNINCRACFMTSRINSMKAAMILICGTDLDIHIMSDSSLILNLSIYKSKYK